MLAANTRFSCLFGNLLTNNRLSSNCSTQHSTSYLYLCERCLIAPQEMPNRTAIGKLSRFDTCQTATQVMPNGRLSGKSQPFYAPKKAFANSISQLKVSTDFQNYLNKTNEKTSSCDNSVTQELASYYAANRRNEKAPPFALPKGVYTF